MEEIKSLTLNGKTYEGFVDPTARNEIVILNDRLGDVLTRDDMDEIVETVITSIPKWTGGSY